jgi:membrane protease YdiL (CAAX protease family)
MFRTWNYAWWRPVVGIVLLAAGMLVILPLLALPVLVVGVLVEGTGDQDFLEAFFNAGTFQQLTPAGLLYLNVALGSLILWTWGLIRFLHQMRPRWLSSVVPKLRWKFLFICVGLSVVALVAQFVVGLLVPLDVDSELGGVNAFTGTTLALAVIVLLTTPFQAIGEEYAFRGYLLQAVGSLSQRRWVALLVTSLLFALAHGFQNFPLFFDRFMFGVIAGWLVIRTGGLEAAIGLHVLNNYLAFGIALTFGDITETLNVSEVSWWNIPVTLTQSLVYAGLVAWVAGRMRLQTRTRPPEVDRSLL